MRTPRALVLCCIVLSGSAAAEPPSRQDELVRTNVEWVRHNTNTLDALTRELNPADCSTAAKARAVLDKARPQSARLKKTRAALQKELGNEATTAAERRAAEELGPFFEEAQRTVGGRITVLKKFHASCPKEAKSLSKEMQAFSEGM